MSVIYGIVSFLVGMSSAVQSSFNGQLRFLTENAMFASFINFMGGTVVLAVLFFAASRLQISKAPEKEALSETRWWMWCGGPSGVIYVLGTILMPPVIGFAAFFSMAIAGQLIASVLMDCFGWMGNRIRKPDGFRIIGALLLFAGAVIIQHT